MKVTPYGILRLLWPKQWLTWWQSADGFSQEPQYRTGWMTCGLWSNFCVWSHLMIKNGGMLPWHPAWGEGMNRQSSKLCNIWCESVISLNYFMPCICLSSFWGLFGNWQIAECNCHLLKICFFYKSTLLISWPAILCFQSLTETPQAHLNQKAENRSGWWKTTG